MESMRTIGNNRARAPHVTRHAVAQTCQRPHRPRGGTTQEPDGPASPSRPLALALFVLRILAADDHHHMVAANHLACLAARLHRRSNFHRGHILTRPASRRSRARPRPRHTRGIHPASAHPTVPIRTHNGHPRALLGVWPIQDEPARHLECASVTGRTDRWIPRIRAGMRNNWPRRRRNNPPRHRVPPRPRVGIMPTR